MNAWAAGSTRRMAELLEIAATTEVNALVIDIKDATGFISHETDLELAREIGADGEIRIRDLPGL
ncbi:MAG: putative glycoside hydrolase, partial [Longimicrobiales bacterium]